MTSTALSFSASQAARQLGVSAKALRLYEERGLLEPSRSAAGWRVYGPGQMARAAEIVALRALGLSLGEVARALGGDGRVLDDALAAHEVALESRKRQLRANLQKIRRLRRELDQGARSIASVAVEARRPDDAIDVSFPLPWPWGGEHFRICQLRNLTHVVGPLGSGKTRLVQRMADVIPGASFIGLDRAKDGAAGAKASLAADAGLAARVERMLAAMTGLGGNRSDALIALATALEMAGPSVRIVDMLEDGLDAPTQEALICLLRRRGPTAAPIVFLTRSSLILDVDAVGRDETIIFCPANHSPPMFVAPHAGSPGYEAMVTCLATPDVRARTQGVVAVRSSA